MPAETTVNTTDGAITYETADEVNTSPGGVTYLQGGKGPPVLLLHAFPLSSAMWRGQVRGRKTPIASWRPTCAVSAARRRSRGRRRSIRWPTTPPRCSTN